MAKKETTRKHERYHHFMVDCETLGVLPNTHPVLQIAIVEFDPVTFTATGKELTMFLPLVEQLKAGAKPDQGTVKWWSEPSKAKVLEEVMAGVNAADTMEKTLLKIYHWLSDACTIEGSTELGKTMFWAKPAAFDFPFIDGLFAKFGVPSPFMYRNVIDVHSFIISNFINTHRATQYYEIDYWQAQQMYWEAMKDIEANEEDAHNATHDCHFQIDWLRNAVLNTQKYFD
ncbi:exonuclease [Acinetobacter phage EAb13]|nr:exonuclease [Acinetobacter phage EAb13]